MTKGKTWLCRGILAGVASRVITNEWQVVIKVMALHPVRLPALKFYNLSNSSSSGGLNAQHMRPWGAVHLKYSSRLCAFGRPLSRGNADSSVQVTNGFLQ